MTPMHLLLANGEEKSEGKLNMVDDTLDLNNNVGKTGTGKWMLMRSRTSATRDRTLVLHLWKAAHL